MTRQRGKTFSRKGFDFGLINGLYREKPRNICKKYYVIPQNRFVKCYIIQLKKI